MNNDRRFRERGKILWKAALYVQRRGGLDVSAVIYTKKVLQSVRIYDILFIEIPIFKNTGRCQIHEF